MNKVKLYLFSFFFLTVFVLSTSKPFMEWWSDYRVVTLKMPFTRARYGDLYSGCFLPGFMDTAQFKLKTYKNTTAKTDLYILHDSYLLGRIKKENFRNIDKLILADFRGDAIHIKPDRTKRNILIIETSERTAGWRLSDTNFIFSRFNLRRSVPPNSKSPIAEKENYLNYLFNPFINQNIEFTLFDYELFKPLKEFKAVVNYNLFNRISKDIAVSYDKKYLFLNETIDIYYNSSSFRYISDEEIDFITNRINLVSEYYLKKGFDKVYFTVVPNPISILEPWRMVYNHKIERIELNSSLKANYIDLYDLFRHSKKQVYRKDDSHWNNYGLQLWMDEVNKKLEYP